MSHITFSQLWNASHKQWNAQAVDSFFSGEQELQQIQNDLKSMSTQKPPEIVADSREYQGFKRSCRSLLEVTLKKIYSALSQIFRKIGLEKFSNYLLVRSIHCGYNASEIDSIISPDLKSKLLVPLRNVHQLGTEDFYLHSPINRSKFCSPNSVSRGISDWFSYLYLKSHSVTCESDQRMRAVASLFSKGAPAQSTLLQANMPGLKRHKFSANFETIDLTYAFSNLDGILDYLTVGDRDKEAQIAYLKGLLTSKKAERVVANCLESSQNSFKKLHEGVYRASLFFTHKGSSPTKTSVYSVTYVKVSAQLSYIVDPSLGVVKFSSHVAEEASTSAYEYLRKRYKKMDLLIMQERSLANSKSRLQVPRVSTLNLLDLPLIKLLNKVDALMDEKSC